MEQCPIHTFPTRLTYREGNAGTFVHGLDSQLRECFDSFCLPEEGKWGWAPKATG